MKLAIKALNIGILLLLCIFSGCSLHEIMQQSEKIENAATITGKVENASVNKGQVFARVYREDNNQIVRVRQFPVSDKGEFIFHLLPGDYIVTAFVDVDNNLALLDTEPSAYYSHGYGQAKSFTLSADESLELETLHITDNSLKYDDEFAKTSISRINKQIGVLSDLDNPLYSKETAKIGFWRPFDFIDLGAGGLNTLQSYDKNKIPVLFIHGIMGSPLEFRSMIESLDTQKYQPWVLYYPSGVRLDMISDYMIKALRQMYDQYAFNDVKIIAHSMGGLMVRSFLMKHQSDQETYNISQLITINSPLYGMDSAASGVENSPIVIPVWRDLASNSAYVKRVHAWTLPKTIPYHLVFSYQDEEEGDGVVPLKSQLSLTLQDEAVKIYGFNAQHASILKDEEFIKRFKMMLK